MPRVLRLKVPEEKQDDLRNRIMSSDKVQEFFYRLIGYAFVNMLQDPRQQTKFLEDTLSVLYSCMVQCRGTEDLHSCIDQMMVDLCNEYVTYELPDYSMDISYRIIPDAKHFSDEVAEMSAILADKMAQVMASVETIKHLLYMMNDIYGEPTDEGHLFDALASKTDLTDGLTNEEAEQLKEVFVDATREEEEGTWDAKGEPSEEAH